jgi:hypothetical protein
MSVEGNERRRVLPVLPTFVIGGAPKAGTTALWALLDAHPEVWMSRMKEPRFLTRNLNEPVPGVKLIGPPRQETHSRGLEWYASLFADGADRPARGEASPQYLGAVDGPEMMERHVPGLKVVFVLRQPVDRAYSQYWQHWKKGWRMPAFSALLDDHPALRYLDYMSRYEQHLERYRQALGADRVHVLLFDDLKSEPARTYAELCRFIGVDDSFQPPDFAQSFNEFAAPRLRWLHRGMMQTHFKRFGRAVPRLLRPSLRRARRSMERWNVSRGKYPPLDGELRERLTERFAPDIAYVERLVRPVPEWWTTRPAPVRLSGSRVTSLGR